MTWHCDEHGEVIPQATGTSYRCPCCTARVVWRDEESMPETIDVRISDITGLYGQRMPKEAEEGE